MRVKTSDSRVVCGPLYLAVAAILFAFPAWKFSNYGLLPDFLVFLESFKNAAAGEMFTNRPHYLQQMAKMAIEPLPGATAPMFGMHFQPFLFLLLPLFKLIPSPYTLLLMQAALVATTIFPLHRLFVKRLQSPHLALAATLCLVFHPIFLGSTTGFFPSYLAIALLSWALLFLHQRRYCLYVLFLLLTLTLKELMAIPVCLAGIHCFFVRSRILGVAICLTAIAYLVLCTEIIIPAFALAGQYHFSDSYGQAKGSIYAAILAMLLSPAQLLSALVQPKVLVYLGNILIPLLFLPLFSLEFLLTIPLFLQNIFAVGVWYSLFTTGHLSAPLLPFLFLAFSRVIGGLATKLSPTALAIILFASVLLNLTFSVSILQQGILADPDMEAGAAILRARIRPGEAIATNANESTIAGHFILTNPIEEYPEGANAPWKVVVYDRSLCRQESTADKNREGHALVVSRAVCRDLNDPCTTLHFDKDYYPNKDFTKNDGVDIRMVVYENTCRAADDRRPMSPSALSPP